MAKPIQDKDEKIVVSPPKGQDLIDLINESTKGKKFAENAIANNSPFIPDPTALDEGIKNPFYVGQEPSPESEPKPKGITPVPLKDKKPKPNGISPTNQIDDKAYREQVLRTIYGDNFDIEGAPHRLYEAIQGRVDYDPFAEYLIYLGIVPPTTYSQAQDYINKTGMYSNINPDLSLPKFPVPYGNLEDILEKTKEFPLGSFENVRGLKPLPEEPEQQQQSGRGPNIPNPLGIDIPQDTPKAPPQDTPKKPNPTDNPKRFTDPEYGKSLVPPPQITDDYNIIRKQILRSFKQNDPEGKYIDDKTLDGAEPLISIYHHLNFQRVKAPPVITRYKPDLIRPEDDKNYTPVYFDVRAFNKDRPKPIKIFPNLVEDPEPLEIEQQNRQFPVGNPSLLTPNQILNYDDAWYSSLNEVEKLDREYKGLTETRMSWIFGVSKTDAIHTAKAYALLRQAGFSDVDSILAIDSAPGLTPDNVDYIRKNKTFYLSNPESMYMMLTGKELGTVGTIDAPKRGPIPEGLDPTSPTGEPIAPLPKAEYVGEDEAKKIIYTQQDIQTNKEKLDLANQEESTINKIFTDNQSFITAINKAAEKNRTGEGSTSTYMFGRGAYSTTRYVTRESWEHWVDQERTKVVNEINESNLLPENKSKLISYYDFEISKARMSLDPVGPAGTPDNVAIGNLWDSFSNLVFGTKQDNKIQYTNNKHIDVLENVYAGVAATGASILTAGVVGEALVGARTLQGLNVIGKAITSKIGTVVATDIAATVAGTTMFHALKESDISSARFVSNLGIPLEVFDYSPDDGRWAKLGKDLVVDSALGLALAGIFGAVGKTVSNIQKTKAANKIIEVVKSRVELRKQVNDQILKIFQSNPNLSNSKLYIEKLTKDITEQMEYAAKSAKPITEKEAQGIIYSIVKGRNVDGTSSFFNPEHFSHKINDVATKLSGKVDDILGTTYLQNLDPKYLKSKSIEDLQKIYDRLSSGIPAKDSITKPIISKAQETAVSFLEDNRIQKFLSNPIDVKDLGKHQAIDTINNYIDHLTALGEDIGTDLNKYKLNPFISDSSVNKAKAIHANYTKELTKMLDEGVIPDPLKDEFISLAKNYLDDIKSVRSGYSRVVTLADASYVGSLLADMSSRILDGASGKLRSLFISLGKGELTKKVVNKLSTSTLEGMLRSNRPRSFSYITPSRSGLDVGNTGISLVTKLMVGLDEGTKQASYKGLIDAVAEKIVAAKKLADPNYDGSVRGITKWFYTKGFDGEIIRNSTASYIEDTYFGKLASKQAVSERAGIIAARIRHEKNLQTWNRTVNEVFGTKIEGLDIPLSKIDELAEEAALLPSFQGGIEGTYAYLGERIPAWTQNKSPYFRFLGRFTRTGGNIAQEALDMTPVGLVHNIASPMLEKVGVKNKALLGGIYNDIKSGNPNRIGLAKVKIAIGLGTTIYGVNTLLNMSDEEFRDAEKLSQESSTLGEKIVDRLVPTANTYNRLMYTAVRSIREAEHVPEDTIEALAIMGVALADNHTDLLQIDQMMEMPLVKEFASPIRNILAFTSISTPDKLWDTEKGGAPKQEVSPELELRRKQSTLEYAKDQTSNIAIEYGVSTLLGSLGIWGEGVTIARRTMGGPIGEAVASKVFGSEEGAVLPATTGSPFDSVGRLGAKVTGLDKTLFLGDTAGPFDPKVDIFGSPLRHIKGATPRPFGKVNPGDLLGSQVYNLLSQPIPIQKNYKVNINGELKTINLANTLDSKGVSLWEKVVLEVDKTQNIRDRVDKVMKNKSTTKAQKEQSINEIIRSSFRAVATNVIQKYIATGDN